MNEPTASQPPIYDPDSVRQHTVAVAAARRIATQALLKVGRHASLARMRLEPAQWAAWLSDIGHTVKEGELLAAAATRFSVNEGADELSPGALLVLSGPDVPPRAIAEALALARRGQLITHRTAAQIISYHTPRKQSAPRGRNRPDDGQGAGVDDGQDAAVR